MKICSHGIIKNKEKKWKCVSIARSKSWHTHDFHAATLRDPTDFIGLTEFCVTGVIVNVSKTTHGNFGAMDPMRSNKKRKSYFGGH